MLKLYYLNTQNSSKSMENYLLKKISYERFNKIKNLKYTTYRTLSLYSELVLRYSLMRDFAMTTQKICFMSNKYGKPFIKGHPNLHFNISHSKKVIVCAISTNNVGVDIEFTQKKSNPFHIAKRFFHPKEYIDIISTPFASRAEYFYAYWTLKESYIKYIGKGFSMPLKDFWVSINRSQNKLILSSSNKHPKNMHLIHITPGYSAAISFDAPEINTIESISPIQLL